MRTRQASRGWPSARCWAPAWSTASPPCRSWWTGTRSPGARASARARGSFLWGRHGDPREVVGMRLLLRTDPVPRAQRRPPARPLPRLPPDRVRLTIPRGMAKRRAHGNSPGARPSIPGMDDEEIAALICGNLTGARRDAALAHLAADPTGEDYEVFVTTLAILREMEAEDARPRGPRWRVPPARRRPILPTGRRPATLVHTLRTLRRIGAAAMSENMPGVEAGTTPHRCEVRAFGGGEHHGQTAQCTKCWCWLCLTHQATTRRALSADGKHAVRPDVGREGIPL